jgi:hypothetical protein
MNIPEFREQQELAIEQYAAEVEQAGNQLSKRLRELDNQLFTDQAIAAEPVYETAVPAQRFAGRSH